MAIIEKFGRGTMEQLGIKRAVLTGNYTLPTIYTNTIHAYRKENAAISLRRCGFLDQANSIRYLARRERETENFDLSIA